jgi:hypothetical protein
MLASCRTVGRRYQAAAGAESEASEFFNFQLSARRLSSTCSSCFVEEYGDSIMSVPVSSRSVVVRKEAIEARIEGGVVKALADSHATSVFADHDLLALSFNAHAHRNAFLDMLKRRGVEAENIALFDVDEVAGANASWLEIEASAGLRGTAWLRGADRSDAAEPIELPHAPYQRHEILSRSESGLHFVRERKSGILRQLTDAELQDFSDPRPCPECGEQFGCEHFNCAGEPLLADDDITAEVPEQWMAFAREAGVSRADLERLRSIEQHDGEYRLAGETSSDMRMLELVLLLNESR